MSCEYLSVRSLLNFKQILFALLEHEKSLNSKIKTRRITPFFQKCSSEVFETNSKYFRLYINKLKTILTFIVVI